MSDFIDAVMAWNRRKDAFVSEYIASNKKTLAPRKNIMITIPLQFEKEIKDFVKLKRKEADASLSTGIERDSTILAIEFEKDNPPPRASDF